MLDEDNWLRAIGPAGSTLEYKRRFAESEQTGDLRNRVLRLGPGGLKAGSVFIGYVSNTSNSAGCFVKVGGGVVARAALNELSDTHVADAERAFFSGKLVVGRIVKVREENQKD